MTQSDKITPMMAQFLSIKEGYPDALLFYRMGDFYELFFEDAVEASAALDIALTKRGKHLEQDIPMCGVPVHSAEGYLLTLIRKGFKVAVCEQTEDPAEAKKRGSKSVVRREVVRLVTPGTLTEESLLEARRHNFLMAYAEIRGAAAFSWVDVSTGDFQVVAGTQSDLAPLLARVAPCEVLLAEENPQLRAVIEESGATVTPLAPSSFDSLSGEKRLKDLFKVAALDSYGQFSRVELSAMGAIIDYLELTQKGKLPLLRPPLGELISGTMQIDAATRRNLELTHALTGGREGSLLKAIDKTITGAGARLLETWITAPSTHALLINDRLDCVEYFVSERSIASEIREALKRISDIDRALARLALERGGPRDLTAIRSGLEMARQIESFLQKLDPPDTLRNTQAKLTGHDHLVAYLDQSLIAEPPLLARDGGFIAQGFDEELDEMRKLRDEGRSVIMTMQADFSKETGIQALKIKHNNVLGYFIETPATHAQKMLSAPFSEKFIHRQTTANAVRFTTLELSELETKILNAGGRALEIEKRIFEEIRSALMENASKISETARALAALDVFSALAELAVSENWTRPKVDETRNFHVVGGRHPVVEHALRKTGESFVANSCSLSVGENPIWLLTGPNMAGKSTFLRQNALIALLAQIGSYVPAEKAHIGIVTQLFSRVGAADELARGRSTFMVEMVETAAILNQAGENALVILDEIGRGTATYDGLAIAWATLEHLHSVNKCRSLFATHYHELTALSGKLDGLKNATVVVREWEGEVIFMHEVRDGTADRSYGVQVAKLAGLPPAVIARAKTLLDKFENRADAEKSKQFIDDLPLFQIDQTPKASPQKTSLLEEAFKEINPDMLSPRDALNLIYELKEKSKSKG